MNALEVLIQVAHLSETFPAEGAPVRSIVSMDSNVVNDVAFLGKAAGAPWEIADQSLDVAVGYQIFPDFNDILRLV